MRSFAEIVAELPSIKDLIQHHDQYWAHLLENRPPETLHAHLQLVTDYFLRIVAAHEIDRITDEILKAISSVRQVHEQDVFAGLLKEMFVAVIPFHDFGKISENFQYVKMRNKDCFRPDKANPFGTGHSRLSTILFVSYYLDKISKTKLGNNGKVRLAVILVGYAYNILRHHASALRQPTKAFLEIDAISLFSYAAKYADQLGIHCEEQIFRSLTENLNSWSEQVDSKEDEFLAFALLKLNYSLLTASDYLATSHYMMQWQEHLSDYGVLRAEQKRRFISNTKQTRPYNKDLFFQYDKYRDLLLESLTEVSQDNLNALRQKMAFEVLETLKQSTDKKLFYLECPTGGGKTNLSILTIAHFLEKDIQNNANEITKVFYVFPYTTLITQTTKVLVETLGLDTGEILALHSRTSFPGRIEEDSDGIYGDPRLNYIDYLFSHYPIILLSHVRFFDIIKTASKEHNYLFHRLANSIVIIDELQSYNPKEWDKVIFFISRMAHVFNMRFVLMSATLPKIDKLSTSRTLCTDLISDAKSRYFSNPNFSNRVVFDFTLLTTPLAGPDQLAREVISKSADYSHANTEASGGVKTVVEFIYKRTASQFYKIFMTSPDSSLFDHIFVLSGTILEPRRREIIAFLKNPDNQSKRVLLICTQVVEAGIDIDMDIGFKDRSLIDSDEQLAGRINRNAAKSNCRLFLFTLDKPDVIYGQDLRYKVTRDEISRAEYVSILQNKDFDILYSRVKEQIDRWNESDFAVNFEEYRQAIRNLNYSDVDRKFKLIDDSAMTVFVPCRIPVSVFANSDPVFSKVELEFLRGNGINKDNGSINGEHVWQLYENILLNRSDHFISRTINIKIIGAVLSKFTFSASNTMLKELSRTFGEEKYGYFYLHNYSDVYDYESGIIDSKLKYSNFI